MKKLMAFDLDGTLLFDRTIDPANVQAIHRWQQTGNLAVCATGKSIFATKLALDKTGRNLRLQRAIHRCGCDRCRVQHPARANSFACGGAHLL